MSTKLELTKEVNLPLRWWSHINYIKKITILHVTTAFNSELVKNTHIFQEHSELTKYPKSSYTTTSWKVNVVSVSKNLQTSESHSQFHTAFTCTASSLSREDPLSESLWKFYCSKDSVLWDKLHLMVEETNNRRYFETNNAWVICNIETSL